MTLSTTRAILQRPRDLFQQPFLLMAFPIKPKFATLLTFSVVSVLLSEKFAA